MISLCNRVRELSIIKISVLSRALLSCYDLEGIKQKERIKRNKRDHIDLMESNDFTYKEYNEQKLLRVDKHSFGHCCN